MTNDIEDIVIGKKMGITLGFIAMFIIGYNIGYVRSTSTIDESADYLEEMMLSLQNESFDYKGYPGIARNVINNTVGPIVGIYFDYHYLSRILLENEIKQLCQARRD